MTAEQQAGQLACLDAVDRALHDLNRAVIITGVGAAHAGEMGTQLARLRVLTRDRKIKPPRQKEAPRG